MAKKIEGYIKLQVPAGAANPSPPIGPALGQAGLNIMEFCKAFNAATQDQDKGIPIPTVITVFVDKSFSFETKTPPASYYIKKAAKLEKRMLKHARDLEFEEAAKLRDEIQEIRARAFGIDEQKAV